MTTRISPGMQSEWSHQGAIGSSPMATAFVAEHRGQFSVRAMCRCLRIQPSGFYAWVKAPLSKRAQEDARQTELLKKGWVESGKVYGHPLPGRALRSNVPRGASFTTIFSIRAKALV